MTERNALAYLPHLNLIAANDATPWVPWHERDVPAQWSFQQRVWVDRLRRGDWWRVVSGELTIAVADAPTTTAQWQQILVYGIQRVLECWEGSGRAETLEEVEACWAERGRVSYQALLTRLEALPRPRGEQELLYAAAWLELAELLERECPSWVVYDAWEECETYA